MSDEWVLVPREPTEAMLTAAVHVKRPDQDRRSRLTIRDLLRLEYAAMIEVARASGKPEREG